MRAGLWGFGVSAVSIIDAEVRELVRRRGVDPVIDPGAVRRLVDDVVAEYEDRSVGGGLPALDDAQQVARDVFDAVAGFGPLQRYFDDPSIEEIMVNEPGRVFIARQGRNELTTTILSESELRDLVERMLKTSGRRVDLSSPFVDALLPDGSRLHVVIPDITRRHWAVNIRKFIVRATHLDELVELGTLTPAAAAFLEAATVSGLNIIVAGGTQAGKTTLLNCLAGAVPARERVVTCEEVFELRIPLPDTVALQCRQANLEGTGEIRLRRLVKEALRMRPSRIIVGEVRQEECLDLLIALNSGLPDLAGAHSTRGAHYERGYSCGHLLPHQSGPRGCGVRRRSAAGGLRAVGAQARLAGCRGLYRQRRQCLWRKFSPGVQGATR